LPPPISLLESPKGGLCTRSHVGSCTQKLMSRKLQRPGRILKLGQPAGRLAVTYSNPCAGCLVPLLVRHFCVRGKHTGRPFPIIPVDRTPRSPLFALPHPLRSSWANLSAMPKIVFGKVAKNFPSQRTGTMHVIGQPRRGPPELWRRIKRRLTRHTKSRQPSP
jgi:hypothetical protein